MDITGFTRSEEEDSSRGPERAVAESEQPDAEDLLIQYIREGDDGKVRAALAGTLAFSSLAQSIRVFGLQVHRLPKLGPLFSRKELFF